MAEGFIGKRVLGGTGWASSVAIDVTQVKLTLTHFTQARVVFIGSAIDALDVEILRLRRRDFKRQGSRWPDLGNFSQQKGQHSRAKPRLAISLAPLFFVVAAGDAIQKFLLIEVG